MPFEMMSNRLAVTDRTDHLLSKVLRPLPFFGNPEVSHFLLNIFHLEQFRQFVVTTF